MKYLLYLFSVVLLLAACNGDSKTEIAKTDTAVDKEVINYPFTPKYSLKWQPGDEKNALIVLTALKHYLDGDIKASLAEFADTVEFIADKFHYKGSRDSLAAILSAMRADFKSVNKVFDTWITTYYPDNKDTWVTLWYTEYFTDQKGKSDSLYYADDVLIKNGKIQVYDEKQRAFPVKAK